MVAAGKATVDIVHRRANGRQWPITTTGSKWFELLCKAAGVEKHKVRSITAQCAIGEPPTFVVEFLGKDEHLQTVLSEDHE